MVWIVFMSPSLFVLRSLMIYDLRWGGALCKFLEEGGSTAVCLRRRVHLCVWVYFLSWSVCILQAFNAMVKHMGLVISSVVLCS